MIADRPEIAKLVAEVERYREKLHAAYKELDKLTHAAAAAQAADTEALANALRADKKAPSGASHEDKRQEQLERTKRTAEAIEYVIRTVTGELRAAVAAVHDEWLTELQDEQLPGARAHLADVTAAWIAAAADLDERYALARWLAAFPAGKGYLPTRRRLVALSGPNGEPIATEVVEDAMRRLAEPPQAPAPEPDPQPLRARGY